MKTKHFLNISLSHTHYQQANWSFRASNKIFFIHASECCLYGPLWKFSLQFFRFSSQTIIFIFVWTIYKYTISFIGSILTMVSRTWKNRDSSGNGFKSGNFFRFLHGNHFIFKFGNLQLTWRHSASPNGLRVITAHMLKKHASLT